MSLIKDLASIIDNGWTIEISIAARRMSLKGVRDFYGRTIWKAERQKGYGVVRKECVWKGFESTEDAIKDLVKKLKPKK